MPTGNRRNDDDLDIAEEILIKSNGLNGFGDGVGCSPKDSCQSRDSESGAGMGVGCSLFDWAEYILLPFMTARVETCLSSMNPT